MAKCVVKMLNIPSPLVKEAVVRKNIKVFE
jgi:hypothetical protein